MRNVNYCFSQWVCYINGTANSSIYKSYYFNCNRKSGVSPYISCLLCHPSRNNKCPSNIRTLPRWVKLHEAPFNFTNIFIELKLRPTAWKCNITCETNGLPAWGHCTSKQSKDPTLQLPDSKSPDTKDLIGKACNSIWA